jgi:hypothetical protein
MKTLATITAAILLTACGGESSSSSEQETTVKPVKVKATYEKALESCGDNLVIEFDDLLAGTNSENIKAKPNDETATASIEGGSNDVCINGNIELLEVSGGSNDVYINGDVKTVAISGGSNDIYIFGNIATLDIEGNSNDIYTKEVAVYNVTGQSNDVMNITDAKL